MVTGMVNGAVDGLNDAAQEAQLNDVVVLGHADGWAERVDNNDNALLSQTAQLAC